MESKHHLLDTLQLEILAEFIITRIEKRFASSRDKWMDGEEVMTLLRIHSKSTLQDLRNKGELRFSKINSKTILYDRESVNDYIKKHIREKF